MLEEQQGRQIEGYFLLNTEEAYETAWTVLKQRYGNQFTVARSFREKLHHWPKIHPKDSSGLREFADFLKGCESAMLHIRDLQILNDCQENQKILHKLPDWLTSRWNRKVAEIEEETGQFPDFSIFVSFVTREAKIACNPVTSLHALKSSDKANILSSSLPKTGKANTFMTGTFEGTTNSERKTRSYHVPFVVKIIIQYRHVEISL